MREALNTRRYDQKTIFFLSQLDEADAMRSRFRARRDLIVRLHETLGREDGSGRSADPMDVPRAMAEIMAMPAGTRPLRRPVAAGRVPQVAINRVSRETQLVMLGASPLLGPLARAVHEPDPYA